MIVNSINNWLGTAILHDTDNAVRSVDPPPSSPDFSNVLLACLCGACRSLLLLLMARLACFMARNIKRQRAGDGEARGAGFYGGCGCWAPHG